MIKIPLGLARKGKIRLRRIKSKPLYIKIVMKGDTTVEDTIPIGLKAPKIFKEIGAVTVCAPVAAEREVAIILGENFE